MKLSINLLLIGAVVILGGVVLPLAVGRESADRVVLWFPVGLTLSFLVEYYWDQAGGKS